MIWRDDDIGRDTRLEDMVAIDDLFQRYHFRHTIAVMAEGMETRPDLVAFIRERDMVVQLHCWTHLDLRHEGRNDLPRAVDLLTDLFGRPPTVLYPPWNRSNDELVAAAAECGLTVSTAKISLSQYIRFRGAVKEDTVNFHHWFPPEALQLREALEIAAARRSFGLPV